MLIFKATGLRACRTGGLRHVLGAALLLGAGQALASATTPASGTVSTDETLQTFSGTTTVAFNPLGVTGNDPCPTSTIECDSYTLTVDLPADYATSHPDVLLRIKLNWEYTTDDYDLYVVDSSGSVVGSSTTSNGVETIDLVPAAGSLEVHVVPVSAYLNSYTGTIELLVPGGDTGGGTTGGTSDTGGDSGDPYDDVPSAPGAPRVVVADIDSGINPYHDNYYHGGPLYGDRYPSAVTKEVLAAFGVKPENVVKLTRTGDIAADIAADQAFWDRVQPGERYHFVGTNIIAASYAGEGLAPLVPDIAKSSHGVGTSSSVINANPEAVLFFLETEGNLGNDDAHDAAFLNPEVDIVTTSYGVSIPYTGFPLPETRAFHDTYKGVVEQGKLHFSSGGNAPGLTPLRAGAGPWWSIGVGGIEEGSSEGDTLISGVFPDFVSDFTQDIPYCMDCESEIDTGVAGTSFSTPRSAGVASAVLLKARRLVGHQGGVQTVDGVPTMVVGKGYHITNWFLRRALEQAAWIPGADEYDPVAGVFDLGGLPINALAPWLQIGWGDLTATDSKAVVEKALSHLELALNVNDKDTGYCDFQTLIIEERKLYWDQIAPFLPDLFGGDQTGTVPDQDPFMFCANSVGTPAANDEGGEPTDTDGDGIVDGLDNCPNVANPGQGDADDNGIGDACETSVNRAPSAAIDGPASIAVGAAASFDASASADPDGDALQYVFDFGDGTTTSGSSATASHVYDSVGSYTVTLGVSDGRGGSDSAQRTISVTADGSGEPGTIDAQLSVDRTTGDIPLTVTFDAGASSGCSGACRYTFVYGDGAQSAAQSAATVSYTYEAAGSFEAYVIVTDDGGASAVSAPIEMQPTTTVTVTGSDHAIAQLVLDNARGPAPLTVTLDGSRSTPADGESITTYTFDFGDGSTPISGSRSVVTHVYTTPGTYQPSLTVTDSAGTTSKVAAKAEVLGDSGTGTGGGSGADGGSDTAGTGSSVNGGNAGALSWAQLLPLLGVALLRRRRRTN
ncbi:PKD domain-containing protein [Solimonas marina]|uniref:PKD domain-containing protein n=1 Tax=Solimonas marina TaxID=2714601 RepID=A0A969W7T7_9GAMM|nr:PKD domain-containing protein [Solimonas marina]NKF21079.1 PKD domain-containing protein [Solimonas marina]